jgi:hypothetical protein
MELYIPPLIVLVLGVIVIFLIIPRLSPYVLAGVALLMFSLGLWQHYSMFPYEYKISRPTDILHQYSGFIVLFIIILGCIYGILKMYGVAAPSVSEMIPEVPAMTNLPTVNLPNMFNGKNGKNANVFNIMGNNAKPANNAKSANNAKPANNAKSANNVKPPNNAFRSV